LNFWYYTDNQLFLQWQCLVFQQVMQNLQQIFTDIFTFFSFQICQAAGEILKKDIQKLPCFQFMLAKTKTMNVAYIIKSVPHNRIFINFYQRKSNII
jgi:hypothetical protein